MSEKVEHVEAVAEAWASIDGKLEQFRAEKAMQPDDPMRVRSGCYEGYMIEAEELLKRVRARGYVLESRHSDHAFQQLTPTSR